MKNLLLVLATLLTLSACNKETQSGPDKTYQWQMGEKNSTYSVDFTAINTYNYTFALVNEGLCGNKGINVEINVNGKKLEGKDLSEMIYTKVLGIKTGDIVNIKTKLIDTDNKIQCVRLGNVRCELK